MDPAEEIVDTWLQQQKFFVRSHVKVGFGGKEIDFLAINVEKHKYVHLEVHAAVFPLGRFRAWGPVKYSRLPLRTRVKHYFEHKFVGAMDKKSFALKNRCIENKATEELGTTEYEKWLVLGVLNKDDDEQELRREFHKHKVKVFLIKDVLKQIRFHGTAKDSTGRFIQLLAATITRESKKSLLS